MGNFEAFIDDYMTYKTREFTAKQTTVGLASVIAAGTGTAIGVFSLIKLGLFVASVGSSVIPGINALGAPLGIMVPPYMIMHGLRAVARDNSWSQLDQSTRFNIIAGVCFIERFITLDFNNL